MPISCHSGAVMVVGSANLDVVVNVPRIPEFGETLLGSNVSHLPGGKGLNQACAAGNTGVQTFFVGAVGDDTHGDVLLAALRANSVNTEDTAVMPNQDSGTAHILVSDAGSNQIVVVPAANGLVTIENVLAALQRHPEANTLVLQGEIPFDVCEAAAEAVETRGGRTVFNLAPAAHVSSRLLSLADPLVVNEFEAGIVLNQDAPTDADTAMEAARSLMEFSRSVIITLGSKGAVVGENGVFTYVPAEKVDIVVDTTGAGDAFVGVVAAELATGASLLAAANRANHAAGLTVTRVGASPSYGAIEDLYEA